MAGITVARGLDNGSREGLDLFGGKDGRAAGEESGFGFRFPRHRR
jgi:hypothetical protein